jgi:hypothetical protein
MVLAKEVGQVKACPCHWVGPPVEHVGSDLLLVPLPLQQHAATTKEHSSPVSGLSDVRYPAGDVLELCTHHANELDLDF